jgi:hypothetical protein
MFVCIYVVHCNLCGLSCCVFNKKVNGPVSTTLIYSNEEEIRYYHITIIYYVKLILHVSTFLCHHQALKENKTKFLNCLSMDPYYDLLSLLS